MQAILLVLTAFSLLVCGGALAAEQGVEGSQAITSEFRRLTRDIPSLYLVNGLHLSAEQAEALARLARRAEREEDRYRRERKRLDDRYAGLLERVLDDAVSAAQRNDVRDGAGRRGRGAARPLRGARREAAELEQRREAALAKLGDEARAHLTASQRDILERFKPCFIPARDFRNPERVGQAAEDVSPAERALERLRAVPEPRLAGATDRAAERLTGFVMDRRHLVYSPEAEAEVRAEIEAALAGTVPRIRAMSDADFALGKSDLAGDVLGAGGEGDTAGPKALGWKVRTYLLNPGIADVLEARAGSQAAQSPAMRGDRGAEPDKQWGDLRAAGALNRLRMSPDQAKALAGIAAGVLREKSAIARRREEITQAGIEAYRELRKQLAAGQPREAAERAAQRVHVAVKRLHEESLPSVLLDAEARVGRVLSAEQIALLTGGALSGEPPPRYGAKYRAGEPVALPTAVSRLLFNETALRILEARAQGG
jgi:hypothetical protein